MVCNIEGQEPPGRFGEHQVLCEQSGIAEHSQEFAQNVSWQKIDERTGAPVEDEDIVDGGDTPGGGGSEPGDNEG